MKKRIISYMLLIIFPFLQATAQINENSIKTKSEKAVSYILTDVSYLNDNVFMGRRDSIAAPYIFPSIGYYDKSGIFIDASLSYLTSATNGRIDLFLLSAGYLFDSNGLSGGLSANGYFFNDESYNVQSEMTASINGLVSYDLKAIELSLLLSNFFNSGSTNDIFSEFQVSRSIYLANNNFWITPTLALGAGTQSFYEAYYQSNRLGNRNDHHNPGQNPMAPNSLKIEEATAFKILNFELCMPMQYYYKSFILSFSPSVAFPQSNATITTENDVIKENLESVFYWSAGISYWFITKKKSSN